MISTRLGIKGWLSRTPSVDEVRPARCLGCGAASRPVGGCLVLHGQGLVRRQIRGVLAANDVPRVHEIEARKYECQSCSAVMTVVPAGVLAGRQYGGGTIALALHLWLVAGLADSAVRARLCAWRVVGPCGGRGWAQLYRWTRTAAWLFPLRRPVPLGDDVEAAAHHVLGQLVAAAGAASTEPMASRVFAGASLAH